MNKTFFLLSIALFFSTYLFSQVTITPEITSLELKKHTSILASDSLRGRYPGDIGSLLSQKYITNQLKKYNIKDISNNGLQEFTVVTGCKLGHNNKLKLNGIEQKLDVDFRPIAFSENSSAKGNIAFVGYGFDINQDSLKWSDYQNINVNGKWVLILREDPEPENMMSEFIAFASDRAKVTLAKDKGAVGVLLVNGLHASKKDKLEALTYDQNISTAGIPVFSITRQAANGLFNNGYTIDSLEKQLIEYKKPNSFEIKGSIEATAEVIQNTVEAKNIVFEIESTAANKSDNYIVIGAHYDHLGMGGKGVSSRMPDTVAVHNGADDNASGVAGIIELAGYLKAHSNEIKHNIIFVAFDAEEMGVLGSKYFVNNPIIPNEKITAMINFDMIGRMKHDTIGITIGGTGTAKEFNSLIEVNKPNFATHFSPDGYGPSDHAPFYSANIPVLFITTGAHSDYHTPFDDVEKLDFEKQKEVVEFTAKLILDISAKHNELTFQSTGNAGKNTRRTRLKVTLGIIPDVAGIVQNGLGIDGVRKGGPADKGGILKGDIITAINGESVSNIYDYMFRLSKLKAGTTAIIEVERNKKKEVLLIQL